MPNLFQMVEEMHNGMMMLPEEGDRDLVVSVKMLIDMGEPVTSVTAAKVQEIYKKYKSLIHGTM